MLPPASQIGPITPTQRSQLLSESIVAGAYEKTLDRESAFEKLVGRSQTRGARDGNEASPVSGASAGTHVGGGLLDSLGSGLGSLLGGGGGRRTSAGEQLIKSAASSIGREVGRQIIRGVLGGIFGGKR